MILSSSHSSIENLRGSKTTYLYIYLVVFSFLITVFSFVIEYIYPFIRNLTEISQWFLLFWCRFCHFAVFLYFTGFCFFYKAFSWNEKIIYLVFALMMEISWDIYDYCPFTYYEFQMYDIKNPMHSYKTTFHPSMYAIFREHSYPVVFLTGIVMVLTVTYIIYDLYWKFCLRGGPHSFIRMICLVLYAFVFYFLIIRAKIGTFTEFRILEGGLGE